MRDASISGTRRLRRRAAYVVRHGVTLDTVRDSR